MDVSFEVCQVYYDLTNSFLRPPDLKTVDVFNDIDPENT
jgi:hypothetical protein